MKAIACLICGRIVVEFVELLPEWDSTSMTWLKLTLKNKGEVEIFIQDSQAWLDEYGTSFDSVMQITSDIAVVVKQKLEAA